MDDKLAQEQCAAYSKSLRRIAEVLQTAGNSNETIAMAAEVAKILRGFKIIGSVYGAQLVKKEQEVKVLQKEKQLLENKVEQLGYMVTANATVPILRGSSNGDLTTPIRAEEQVKILGKIKDGHVKGNLHLKCEGDLHKRELELAKLREAYIIQTSDLRECLKEKKRVEMRLKNVENQAATKEQESLDEINKLKSDIVRLKEEITEVRKEAGKLEEQLGKATARTDQFVELLKRDSKQQDELRRQQKNLKGYLQLLASKYASKYESENMQFELRGLECRGLDEDITCYLKTILERSIKPAKSSVETQTSLEMCSVETQTSLIQVLQSSSSTQTWYTTTTEGTQTTLSDHAPALREVSTQTWYSTAAECTQTTISDIPSALDPTLPSFPEDLGHDVFHDQWALNFDPVETVAVKAPQNVDENEDILTRHPDFTKVHRQEFDRENCLDLAGSKRPIEVIDLGSDSDDESLPSEKGHDLFQHKHRKLSPLFESASAVSLGKKGGWAGHPPQVARFFSLLPLLYSYSLQSSNWLCTLSRLHDSVCSHCVRCRFIVGDLLGVNKHLIVDILPRDVLAIPRYLWARHANS